MLRKHRQATVAAAYSRESVSLHYTMHTTGQDLIMNKGHYSFMLVSVNTWNVYFHLDNSTSEKKQPFVT